MFSLTQQVLGLGVDVEMYKAIINYLCCPVCRNNLVLQSDVEIDDDVMEGLLTCESGHTFHIHKGVVDFNSVEQGFANQWETLDENQDFEELDRDMDEKNPVEIIQRRELVLRAIVDAVLNRDCKVILDIASGRGLMLTELVRHLDDDVHIISIDLSEFVLQYDHRKFKRIAPNKKISYLACNATNLPLKDCVIDAATTYSGFSNMVGCADRALLDAHRVIKPGGVLVDSYVVIERESQGYEILHKVCTEQKITGAEEFFLHDGVAKHHEDLFSVVECREIFEGIGVGNDMDLLPYDGEWYAEQVFVSVK